VVFPLAAAGLPDPLWIGGVYDGEDDDDLIAQSTDVGSTGRIALLVPSLPVGLLGTVDVRAQRPQRGRSVAAK
jgi:hypothetical protein